jgi:ABC-type multidrug transport system fused ATPase/permease subunit
MASLYSHETEESLMARVAFENVVKKYGDVTAVNNLNIDVADKEFLVLVGPSLCAVWPDWKRSRAGTLRSLTA